ncbi:hypothetical protein [Streptomyces sp. NBC_01244]|uniref:hypothetical protein n=1 Tax=Streptomyces sp. NBC_01244 TaxID=2903797 RepID=UPI002E13DA41|nr:hypothetical protein OG247_44490 [Streptomyces sp. NBC_01244]
MPTPEEALALAAPYTGFFRPGLPGVPLHRIHCTLLHTVGLPFEGVDLDALLDDVEGWARQVQPFTITFDRPAIGNVAVELDGLRRRGRRPLRYPPSPTDPHRLIPGTDP